jgi:hypothetical protein
MKSLGSYTLGDQYVSPERRLSAMLTQQGSRGGPSNSWQETMGRIAQQLAGAYIGRQDSNKQNQAFDAMTGLEPNSYSLQPTMNDQQIMESPAVQKILQKPNDAERMQNPNIQNNIKAIGYEQDHISDLERMNQSINDKLGSFNSPADAQREIDFNNQSIARANQNIDSYGDKFNRNMAFIRGGELTDDQRADRVRDQLIGQRNASMENTLNEKMNPRDYSMQQLRGLENNPYAKRILAQMMMQNADRDYAAGLAQTARGYVDSDYERKREDDIEDRDKKLESDKTIANLKQSLPVTGIREYQQAVKLGLFKGSYEDYLQTKAGYGSNTPTGTTEKPAQVGGIPAGSPPWSGLPIKEQAKMRQSSYKEAAKMLEKNRQSLVSNQTMSDSLKRFAYLNAKQDKEAENEYFGTKTGSLIDRMPLGGLPSFDDEKIEMESISSLLTPQMRQGMPGAASDRDVAMFANATVGINRPKEINDNLIAGMSARFENASDRQSFMEEFLTQNKHLNGAEQEWRGYLEANPIFDPDPALEGQYALNKSRQGYKEYFSSGGQGQANKGRRSGEPNNGGPLSPDEKKRLEELRRKARGQ